MELVISISNTFHCRIDRVLYGLRVVLLLNMFSNKLQINNDLQSTETDRVYEMLAHKSQFNKHG